MALLRSDEMQIEEGRLGVRGANYSPLITDNNWIKQLQLKCSNHVWHTTKFAADYGGS